ncbi:MAG: NAD(P)H-binding protein [Pseudomonadota bacterium]
MSRTLVFGASGFVGQELLLRLSGKITAISRAKIMDDSSSIKWCTGDLTKKETVLPANLLAGANTAYHLAASFESKPQVTEAIVTLCEKIGVKRLIMLSQTGCKFDGLDAWHKDSYIAEGVAINSVIPEVILVRVPILVSKKKTSPFDLYIKEFFKLPLFYPVFKAKSECALVSVEDLSIYLEKLSKTEVSEPRNIIDLATSKFTMKAIMSNALTQYALKPKIGLGHFLGSWLSALIDLWGRKQGRKAMRNSIYRALANQPDLEMVPSGVPNPRVYKSIKEIYL